MDVTSSAAGAGRPAMVGRYRIDAELGRGMMGVVYKAHDPLMDRSVALKVVRLAFAVDDQQRASFDARFMAEARIVARLSHPNIVVAYDVGRDGTAGPPFIALEYLQGRTLAQTLADARPDWRTTVRLIAKLAEALHYAHEQGVVHRDVKPANVMVLPNGEPKLMDFGLARLRAGLEGAASAALVGTPLYMAPEQALGREVDARSDLFSLGSLAYTLLTGRRAFEAESVPRILQRVAFDEPARPTRVQRDLPASLDYVLARALAKDPAARYANGRLFAEDCDDVLHLRPPRHRVRWIPPPTLLGEGTQARPTRGGVRATEFVGSGSMTAESPLPAQAPAAVPALVERQARRGSRWPLMLLGLGMLVVGAGLFASPTWRQVLAAWLGVASAPAPSPSMPWANPFAGSSAPSPVAPGASPVADVTPVAAPANVGDDKLAAPVGGVPNGVGSSPGVASSPASTSDPSVPSAPSDAVPSPTGSVPAPPSLAPTATPSPTPGPTTEPALGPAVAPTPPTSTAPEPRSLGPALMLRPSAG